MCGSQTHELLAGLDLLAVADHDRRTVRHLVLLEFAALGVDDGDFAVALQGDERLSPSASFTSTALMSRCSTVPPSHALMSFSIERPVATPPVWNVRIVSCVPGSPMDWAAMMPTARPSSTSWLVDMSMP